MARRNSPSLSRDAYIAAIELMLRERVTLLQATSILGLDETPESCSGHLRRKEFQTLYAAAARAYFAEQGGALGTEKNVLVGQILDDAARLRAMGKPEEAYKATERAAKLLGYGGAETNINFFSEMSGSELQEALARLRKKRDKPETTIQ